MKIIQEIIYDITVFLFTRIINLFFREINSRGSHLVPASGPVIFVVAPHANQFVDPLVLLKHCKRRVGFLVAKKSYDKRWIGLLARAVNSIPVARAQDYAFQGMGSLMVDDKKRKSLFGKDCDFLKHVQKKDGISVCGVSMDVGEVVTDTEILLSKELSDDDIEKLKEGGDILTYKIIPHLDQSRVYKSVHERLAAGESIGIFPEGGSHDRAQMLPLKVGVAIMALGAMAENPDLDVKIIPCGSRASIEFGNPISIDKQLVEDFKKDGTKKREACSSLLLRITRALRSVTVNASDYEALQVIQAGRRLYKPERSQFSMHQTLELTRRFAKAYELLKDKPSVKEFAKNVLEYNKQLEIYGLRDHQVKKTGISRLRSLQLFLVRFVKLIFFMAFALPGLVLNFPIIILTQVISKRKALEAKLASTVKIAGRDVLATWKLMVALVATPILYTFYSSVATYVLKLHYLPSWSMFTLFSLTYCSLCSLSFATIRFGEEGVEIMRSLVPLVLAMLPYTREYSTKIRRLRQFLEAGIISLVNELGPLVFQDFNEQRLVEEDERRKQFLLDQLTASSETVDSPDDWLNWKEVSSKDIDDVFFTDDFMD